jgi:hypothetical protein
VNQQDRGQNHQQTDHGHQAWSRHSRRDSFRQCATGRDPTAGTTQAVLLVFVHNGEKAEKEKRTQGRSSFPVLVCIGLRGGRMDSYCRVFGRICGCTKWVKAPLGLDRRGRLIHLRRRITPVFMRAMQRRRQTGLAQRPFGRGQKATLSSRRMRMWLWDSHDFLNETRFSCRNRPTDSAEEAIIISRVPDRS